MRHRRVGLTFDVAVVVLFSLYVVGVAAFVLYSAVGGFDLIDFLRWTRRDALSPPSSSAIEIRRGRVNLGDLAKMNVTFCSEFWPKESFYSRFEEVDNRSISIMLRT